MLRTPLFRRLDLELRARRAEMLRDRGWAVTAEEEQNVACGDVFGPRPLGFKRSKGRRTWSWHEPQP